MVDHRQTPPNRYLRNWVRTRRIAREKHTAESRAV